MSKIKDLAVEKQQLQERIDTLWDKIQGECRNEAFKLVVELVELELKIQKMCDL